MTEAAPKPENSPGPIRRAVYRAHFVLAAVLGGLSFVVISAAGLLYALVLPKRGDAATRLAGGFHRVMTSILGWKVSVEGREHLEITSPVVWMIRHQSNLDIVTLGGIYPPRTVVIGKKEIGQIPVFGWFFRATGNILIDRRNFRSAVAAIRSAAGEVREKGLSVWVFPEGHRNQGRQLLPFKKGAFHLAVATQFPIVPIATEPIETLLDGHRWAVRPGTYRIRVLEAVPTAGLTADDVDALAETVREKLQEAQDELAREADPPILPSRPA